MPELINMAVEMHEIEVETKAGTDVVNITGKVEGILRKSKASGGLVTVFVEGSTASVSTMEFESNLVSDLKDAIERIVPSKIPYRHTEARGDDNGHSHIRAAVMGPGLSIPFAGKRLRLGTWQQVVLIDFDVPPRKRKITIQNGRTTSF